MKIKEKDENLILKLLLGILIILSICFLAVGYAAISTTNLNIGLTVTAKPFEGMFISNAEYYTDNGADLANCKIVSYSETMLHTNIMLSPSDTSSSITYEVTIFNNSDSLKQFKGITYLDDLYSNKDIVYTINGFAVGQIIEKGESKTFNITFSYGKISTITNNNLESYLNFNFDYYFEEENDVDIVINEGGSFEFAGVSPENPIDLANISNISFLIKNATGLNITGVQVDVTYTTTSGSLQSAKIYLQDEEHNEIANQTVQFDKKVTNRDKSIIFENINIQTNEKLHISFDKNTITNGKVDVSRVVITPIFE